MKRKVSPQSNEWKKIAFMSVAICATILTCKANRPNSNLKIEKYAYRKKKRKKGGFGRRGTEKECKRGRKNIEKTRGKYYREAHKPGTFHRLDEPLTRH
jgi:hypothetical protein